MKLAHWKFSSLVVSVMLLAIAAVPGTALAQSSSPPAAQTNDKLAQTAGNKVVIPGIMSLIFDTALNPQVDIAALNATAKVEGLSIANGLSYDSINLTQKSPATVQNWLISGAQVSVGAPASGYSTEATAHVALQPATAANPLLEGTVALTYDGIDKALGLSVQDGNAYFAAGPAVVTVAGANRTPGNSSVDTVDVAVPSAGASLHMDGFSTQNGAADWNSLTLSKDQVTLGNVAALSGLEVRTDGPSTGFSTDATMHYTLGTGQVAQAEGQLVTSFDGVNRTMTFALHDATATVNAPGFNLAASGLNYENNAMQVDSITFKAPNINLSGELNNVTLAPGGGVNFDKASVLYQPAPASASTGKASLSGFEFTITKTGDGYMLTTNTMLSPAK